MKKAKENWLGEQCSEIDEENLRKNNTKRAYQLVKDLNTETRESYYFPRIFFKKNLTEEGEILNRWTEYCSVV